MARGWVNEAIRRIEADFNRSADTHLLRLDLAAFPGIALYFKDESTHPTGSLKHRLARSLFLYGLCNGHITEGRAIIEASSGSTAVSEAYFARLLGLPFYAVMPRTTSAEKIQLIEFYGGRCHLVDNAAQIYEASHRLAAETSGHFMDQFTYAERATDWRGNNNIAQSIFDQMAREASPDPAWIVVGAGTGGTSATIGRFVRYKCLATRVCVVDPENSVFYDFFRTRDRGLTGQSGSRVEGIGRPRVEPSFLPEIVDHMIKVPDAASFAAMRLVSERLGRLCGGSTGTNFVGALELMCAMKAEGRTGSVVTLLCDGGERYRHTYYDDAWLAAQGHDMPAARARITTILDDGIWRS
jgi:cysteine synthase A